MPRAIVGHKAAFGRLRVVEVTAEAAAPAGGAPATALLWRGRVLMAGSSKAAALQLPAAGCTATLHEVEGAIWCTAAAVPDGRCLAVLELGEGAVLGTSITPAELDALQWSGATCLDAGGSVALRSSQSALIAVGVHVEGAGLMSTQLERLGAALLAYEPLGQPPRSVWEAAPRLQLGLRGQRLC